MANKWKAIGLSALLLLLALQACKSRQKSGHFAEAFIDADTIWAYKVDGYPVAAADQKKELRYLYGYEVKQVHPLTAPEILSIRTVVADPSTFDTTAVKSCPMVAQYALAVRKKGKTPAAIVVSPSPCGKALVFQSKNPAKPICMELSQGNKLEGLLTGMW